MQCAFYRLVFVLLALLVVIAGTPAAQTAEPAPSRTSALRLDDFLWRELQDREDRTLGSVSDVLVQMPSGRIVFVAVVPAEFFERPKAVPPGALAVPEDREAPIRLDITKERWIDAPRLDWDSVLVIKNTREGSEIYGYYQQPWREPEPLPPWGVEAVAPRANGSPPERYVSLKKLLLDRVVTPAWEQAGYVRDFLLDWPARRATHALVSPRFTPLASEQEAWFAVPVPLLNPPVEGDALIVNSDVEAFRDAPRLARGKAPRTMMEIYRYPAAWK